MFIIHIVIQTTLMVYRVSVLFLFFCWVFFTKLPVLIESVEYNYTFPFKVACMILV